MYLYQLRNELKKALTQEQEKPQTSNKAKDIRLAIKRIELCQYLRDDLNYKIMPNNNGIYNVGHLFELAYKTAQGGKPKTINGLFQKDIKGHYSEIKAIYRNGADITSAEIKRSKGLIIGTYQGIYKMEMVDLVAHLDELKEYKKGAYRLTKAFVEKYAELDTDIEM